MRNKRGKILANIDWLSIIIIFVLMIMGWVNIYAAVYDESHSSIFDLSQRYGKQLLWIGIAFPISFFIMIIDSKFYSAFAYFIFAIGILSLIAVLIFGVEINSSKSWFEIGNFRVQPAEFMKFMLCLALAQLISSKDFAFSKKSSLLRLSLVIGLPTILVFLQNDTGTALVFFSLIFVFYREGMNSIIFFSFIALIALFILAMVVKILPLFIAVSIIVSFAYYIVSIRNKESKIILIAILILSAIAIFLTNGVIESEYFDILGVLIVVSCIILMLIFYLRKKDKNLLLLLGVTAVITVYIFSVDYVFDNMLQEHQQNRINQVLGKHSDPLGVGYNLNQSKIAIGSGGFAGKGFLQGTQTKYNFVPEQSTDFIFCTIGEEWGLIGSSLVLFLLLFLVLRILFLAERQRSTFSRIYGYGVASVLFFHIAINIGMTIGLAPIIGIPLPFFSYGGSSLWAFTILIMIFLKLDSDKLQIFR